MNIRVHIALCFFIGALFFIAAADTGFAENGVSAIGEDEYAVFSAAVQQMFGENQLPARIVIQEMTSCTYLDGKSVGSALDYFVAENPHIVLSPELIENFKSRNGSPCKLEKRFSEDINVRVLLFTEEMRKSLFGSGAVSKGGWSWFYEIYGGAWGIITLSRAGIDHGSTSGNGHAIIYYAMVSGSLSGGGYILYLENKNGVWTIEKRTMLWIS